LLLTSSKRCKKFKFSASKEVIVVSDLHLGSSWFSDQKNLFYFKEFLLKLTKKETKVHTFIILGDLIETWLTPFNERPKSVQEIFTHKNLFNANISEFLEILNQISKNDVSGNHFLNLDSCCNFERKS
jgi:UDP-2,3-diacylglucosamine pyrophosphatase LpxH